jgi:hypothetical protein
MRASFVAPLALLVAIGLAICPLDALAAGHAFSANFSVLAPHQALAETALAEAEFYRAQVATKWFGERLPEGAGRVLLSIEIADGDRGLTWAGDGARRQHHHLWLTVSPTGSISHALHHEIVHCVLNTKYPNGLPVWFEEGVASAGDDAERRAICRRIVARGELPRLDALLAAEHIAASEQASYAAASSLVEYLLTRGDRARLLAFALAGPKQGWEAAARQSYGVQSLGELETAWRLWIAQPPQNSSR